MNEQPKRKKRMIGTSSSWETTWESALIISNWSSWMSVIARSMENGKLYWIISPMRISWAWQRRLLLKPMRFSTGTSLKNSGMLSSIINLPVLILSAIYFINSSSCCNFSPLRYFILLGFEKHALLTTSRGRSSNTRTPSSLPSWVSFNTIFIILVISSLDNTLSKRITLKLDKFPFSASSNALLIIVSSCSLVNKWRVFLPRVLILLKSPSFAK